MAATPLAAIMSVFADSAVLTACVAILLYIWVESKKRNNNDEE